MNFLMKKIGNVVYYSLQRAIVLCRLGLMVFDAVGIDRTQPCHQALLTLSPECPLSTEITGAIQDSLFVDRNHGELSTLFRILTLRRLESSAPSRILVKQNQGIQKARKILGQLEK